MKRLALILSLAAISFGIFASAGHHPATADSGPSPSNWPALLNCSDVNADGSVSMIDIGQIVVKFGTKAVLDSDGKFVPAPDYMLLYDVDGGGIVGITDIGVAVSEFGTICPEVETQVAAATLAMAGLPPYDSNTDLRDWSAASGDGWQQTTQYVPSMGIHVQNLQFLTKDFNHLTPVGTVYKNGGGQTPDDLIGAWFVVPSTEVCEMFTSDDTSGLFGVDPQTCVSTQPSGEPAGFADTEDNAPGGWHDHTGLCTGKVGTTDAQVVETFQTSQAAEDQCLAGTYWTPNGCGVSGCFWFDKYGWMIHLYNFIPNPSGRFQMWNSNT